MKNGKVVGIIVARCSSSRLSNKAITKILGRETIALLIERIQRCRNLDEIVLATTPDPSDDVLIEIARREGILSFRGSLENVALRMVEAAKYCKADTIVRITGDDILRDERMIDRAVGVHLEGASDVTFMKNMPYGTSSEVFSFRTLETIVQRANVPENTEYLTWYLENERYFRSNVVDSGYQFDEKLRMTLDYEEDLHFFQLIFENFYVTKPHFTMPEVLRWLGAHPEIVAVNQSRTAKFTSRDLDVTLNI